MNQGLPPTSQGLCPSLQFNSYFLLYIAHIFIFITRISFLASVDIVVVCIARVLRSQLVDLLSVVVNMPCCMHLCTMYHMHT